MNHATLLATSKASVQAKPFLTWVGGKRSILPQLVERLPKGYENYHEPFIGGGALFFSRSPQKAYLSDINYYLITAYQVVRDNLDDLMKELERHSANHSKEYYFKVRDSLSFEGDPIKIAGLFIYLNKACFNGIYKTGRDGAPCMSFGKNTLAFPTTEAISAVSEALQGVEIHCHSFECTPIEKEAFYYFDPPYHEEYNHYDLETFSEEYHKRLACFCQKIHENGGYFMVSNSDTRFVRRLYKPFTIEIVESLRSLCHVAKRGKTNELIIRNY